MKIISLGIDQGIANLGYAITEIDTEEKTEKLLVYGTLKTKSTISFEKRIEKIYDELDDLIKKHKPELISCEKLFFNQKQSFSKRNKSASMMYTNMATGLLYLVSAKNSLILKDFVPGTVKKQITGKGNATKEEMIECIKTKFNLESPDEHICDAIGISLTGAYQKDRKKIKSKKKKTKLIKENKEKLKTKEKTKKTKKGVILDENKDL